MLSGMNTAVSGWPEGYGSGIFFQMSLGQHLEWESVVCASGDFRVVTGLCGCEWPDLSSFPIQIATILDCHAATLQRKADREVFFMNTQSIVQLVQR